MSKIGQQPIEIPNGVTVEINGNTVDVVGPKGKLSFNFTKEVNVKIDEGKVLVGIAKDSKIARSIWGTTRMLISNMIKGVTEGWKKQLELVGTGYRAEVNGNTLVLTVGYSHPIKIEAPEEITFKVEKSIITVEGIDKQVVGQVSANIRSSRPPEPYKGKGVKYIDEIIRRKAGKAAKAAAQ
ncbi:MAG: 50S ribosomal protein L6 [Candidatus Woesebacteria bacterium]|nr:50S ribosomal protein L6 [Candidatus Woesebacteria bacterium]